MTSLELLLWSVALYTAGGFISLLFKQQEKMAVYVAGITAIAGGILGLFSAVPVLMSGETLTFFAQAALSRSPILSSVSTASPPLW